jgi:N-acetylneuraminic acid mutarotase
MAAATQTAAVDAVDADEHAWAAHSSGSVAAADAGAGVDWDSTPVLSWLHPTFTGRAMSARGGHAAALVGNLLVSFGGHYYGGEDRFVYCNDVWAVDIDTMTWHAPKCAGRGPGPRYGHTATMVDYKLYVFGGRGPSGLLYNDLWCLDVETWAWTLLPSTTAPPLARCGHATVAVGNRLAVFGGWDGSVAYNDVWVYDIAGRTWLRPRVRGPSPPPRHGHSLVLTDDGRLVVHGGWAVSERGFPQYLNDTRVLDTATMTWTRPLVAGDPPPPGYGHSATMVGRFMVLLGGYGGNQPKPPPALASATRIGPDPRDPAVRGIQRVPDSLGDSCPPPLGTAVSADGTEVPLGRHPFLWLLDTGGGGDDEGEGGEGSATRPARRDPASAPVVWRWSQPVVAGQPPGKRYGHTAVAVGPHVLALGGWDGNKALGDVIQLDLSPLVGPGVVVSGADATPADAERVYAE